jgi:hypothetical protein
MSGEAQWHSDQAIGERALREDAERCRKCRAGKSMTEDLAWEKNVCDRFLSVYGAAVAVQWAAHIREGRGLDDESIRRFVSEARALAQWTEEVQHV